MSDVTFVQGDTGPDVTGQILKKDGTPRDLTTAGSIKFQMRKNDDHRYTVDAAADVLTPSEGRVAYSWDENELSVPGEYMAQWEITWNDGKIQTTQPPNTLTVRAQ